MKALDMTAAGFVLVGGQSRRMGRDKALLQFRGKPLLLRAAELLQPFADPVTLLGPTSLYSRFGFPVLPDARPGLGPLGAIYTGLSNTTHDWNLFLACDLPFLTPRIVELLLQRASGTTAQAVVPVPGGRYQPLCAAYHRSCLSSIEAILAAGGSLSLHGWIPRLRADTLAPEPGESGGDWEDTFRNVNTREQWELLQSSVTTDAA